MTCDSNTKGKHDGYKFIEARAKAHNKNNNKITLKTKK